MTTIEKSINCEKKTSVFKCTNCDFVSYSNQGLKVHMARKHTLKGNEKYPLKCHICDIDLKDSKEMKKHMMTHSYKKAGKLKCKDCEFLGDNKYSMEVHIGKYHSDKFECGLCDDTMKTLSELEVHLFTCEVYKCFNCGVRLRTLGEIKKHIRENHTEEDFVFHHLKIERNDEEEVKSTQYYFGEVSEEE